MDEFGDEDIQLSIEANDEDTRIALTIVSVSGKKIGMADFLMCVEEYLKEVTDAEIERNIIGAKTQ